MKPSAISPDQRPTQSSSPVDTPSFGAGGHHSVICSTTIRAPISTILTALLDTRTYPTWNRFCPHVTIDSQPSSAAPQASTDGDSKDANSSLPADLAVDPSVADLPTTLRLGTAFTLDVHLKQDPSSKRDHTACERLSILEEFRTEDGRRGVRLAWCTADRWTPAFMLKCERVQELVEKKRQATDADGNGDGEGHSVTDEVQYICWETFYGVLSPVVTLVAGKALLNGFAAWMDGLKEYAEKQVQVSKKEAAS